MTCRPDHTGPTRRVVVVDDQALLVSAFSLLLNSQPDLEVAATAGDGRRALEVLRALAARGRGADLVLMDIRMPVLDGIATIGAMAADHHLREVPVLVLTTFDEEELVLGALRAGARGFLLKDVAAPVLLEAVRTVAAGGSWLDPAVTSTVLAHLGEPEAADGAGQGLHDQSATAGGDRVQERGLFEPLTAREGDVLELVCQGLANADIGARLHLAESTVKTHVKALLSKTGCRNRVELIVHAYRHDLALPG